VGVPTSLEQVEAGGKALEDLGRSERPRSCGGELDREREVVPARATLAELGDLVRRIEPGALTEEGDGLLGCEGRDGIIDLALDAQELARGAEEGEVRTGPEELRELGGGVDHLFHVVEQ